MKENYPYIKKLGLKVREKPYPHIRAKDLETVLRKKDRKLFSEYFGVQTCLLLDDGTAGLYIWDVEAVLHRMFTGELILTQKYWD